jgi:hypothetical protein
MSGWHLIQAWCFRSIEIFGQWKYAFSLDCFSSAIDMKVQVRHMLCEEAIILEFVPEFLIVQCASKHIIRNRGRAELADVIAASTPRTEKNTSYMENSTSKSLKLRVSL